MVPWVIGEEIDLGKKKEKIYLQSPSLLSDDLYLDISNVVFQAYSWKGWGVVHPCPFIFFFY